MGNGSALPDSFEPDSGITDCCLFNFAQRFDFIGQLRGEISHDLGGKAQLGFLGTRLDYDSAGCRLSRAN